MTRLKAPAGRLHKMQDELNGAGFGVGKPKNRVTPCLAFMHTKLHQQADEQGGGAGDGPPPERGGRRTVSSLLVSHECRLFVLSEFVSSLEVCFDVL